MLTPAQRTQLKAAANHLEPIVRIGKEGFTEAALLEINKHLKKRKLIKIRILKPVFEKLDKEAIETILKENTKSNIVSFIGNIVTLNYGNASEIRE
ncbi:MAG TPA: YhbY family RNA-binding protein [Acidobacteriota bacterium]|nr:YhbY family RNA-binding protein [Acidobacteriota bacterium]